MNGVEGQGVMNWEGVGGCERGNYGVFSEKGRGKEIVEEHHFSSPFRPRP